MSSFFSPIRIARLMHMPKKFSSLWIYFLYVALWTCTVEFLPAVFVHKFPFGPRKTFLALRKVLHLDHESKIHRRVILDLVCNLCCPVNSVSLLWYCSIGKCFLGFREMLCCNTANGQLLANSDYQTITLNPLCSVCKPYHLQLPSNVVQIS